MTQPQEGPDFALNIYRGCVLPEDYKPARTTTWTQWAEANSEGYSPDQLAQLKSRLLAGKSWVCFYGSFETISAPEHYMPAEPAHNPIRPKERLI